MTDSGPDVFKKAARCLDGGLELYETEWDLLLAFLSSVDEDERDVLRRHLDDLLSGQYSIEQLNNIWHETNASIDFHDDVGLKWLLQEAQSALADFPAYVARESKRLSQQPGA